MRTLQILKQSFAAGQYDVPMSARNDVGGFESAAFSLKNVVGLPRGGVEQRGGMKKIVEISAGSDAVRLFSFKFNVEQKYVICFYPLKIDIIYEGAIATTVVSPYTADDIPDLCVVQQLDSMIICSQNHPPAKLMRQGAHDSWSYATITFTNPPQHDFTGTPEAAWSATRGYPGCCNFHEGRLFFGGTPSLPNMVWGSKTNSPFDFSQTVNLLDDEAVSAQLQGGSAVSIIRSISSYLGFFVFTTEGPYALTKSPITPKNFLPVRHESTPAGRFQAQEMDGAMLFLTSADGSLRPAVNEFVWDSNKSQFETNDLNIRCYNVLKNPVGMACRRGNETDAANHLFVVNEDGTMAVLNLKRAQQMVGWTTASTKGKILSVCVLDAEVFFLVKRSIANVDRYFIEQIDRLRTLDCSVFVTQSPSTTVSGLSAFEGETVDVVADAAPIGQRKVESGKITLPIEASKIEVGFAFDVEITPFPPVDKDGTNLISERWSVTKLSLMLENTLGCKVNGKEIVAPKFGTDVFDVENSEITGWKDASVFGWIEPENQKPFVITTTSDKRITLHAVNMEVLV